MVQADNILHTRYVLCRFQLQRQLNQKPQPIFRPTIYMLLREAVNQLDIRECVLFSY